MRIRPLHKSSNFHQAARKSLILILLVSGVSTPAQTTDAAEQHLRQGKEFLTAKEYQKAIIEFKEATHLQPKLAEAYFQLGLAYQMVRINNNVEARDQIEAGKAFEKAIKLKPDFAEAHARMGSISMTFLRNDEAIKSLKEAIRLKPDMAEAQADLGIVYLRKGTYQEAIRPLEESVRLKPDVASTHQTLGLAYLAVKQKEKALEQYDILTRLDPKMATFLRSKIESGDSPTFGFAKGKALSIPQPSYPTGMTWTGKVTVEVMIDETGRVTAAHALAGGPDVFRRLAEQAAMKARFEPTKISGTPIALKGAIEYNFLAR